MKENWRLAGAYGDKILVRGQMVNNMNEQQEEASGRTKSWV